MVQSICTFAVTVLLEFLLLEEGVTLHLIDSWYNLGCLEKTLCLCDGKVGDSDALGETLADSLLHPLHITHSAEWCMRNNTIFPITANV